LQENAIIFSIHFTINNRQNIFVNADVIDSLAEYEFIKQTEMDDILSLLIKTAL